MTNQETSLKTSFSKYLTVLATGIHSLYRRTISKSNVISKNKRLCATENSSEMHILQFHLKCLSTFLTVLNSVVRFFQNMTMF